jgi:DNA invertase Pin-like site-specific DNA recombinase
LQPDLPREGQRRAANPPRVATDAESHRPRRRGDGDADRLARSTFDLFAIVKQIVDAGSQFRSLAEPWADTSTSTGRLMIAILGGLADVERDLIRTRTAEGRSRAKARGQHMGRPPKLTPQQQKEARRRRAQGATLAELAKSYNVGRATISRLAE